MSEIVDELRRMCAVEEAQYTVAGTAYWSDDQLQAVLDRHVSAQFLQAPVERIRTLDAGNRWVVMNGEVSVSGALDIEAAKVTDSAGREVEDTTFHSDGRIEFATDQSTYFLYLTGLAYDLNGAAADVLTDWAAAVKGGYDVTVDGQQMTRSQRHTQLLEQAKAFRSRAIVGSVRMRRGDQRSTRRRRHLRGRGRRIR
ncbi:MAG TPA: hypothetical protein VLC07_02620 [Solirubrobacterales bacterium]|nr:hypothetical protein [Solirubrobacterales bacterium]